MQMHASSRFVPMIRSQCYLDTPLAFIFYGVMVSFDHFAFITTHAASLFSSNLRETSSAESAHSVVIGSAAAVTKRSTMSSLDEEHDYLMLPLPAIPIPQTPQLDAAADIDEKKSMPINNPIHFCFIVHGHHGRPTDLSYLHSAVKSKAKETGIFADAKSSDSCVVGQISQAIGTKNGNNVPSTRRKKRDRLPFSRKKKGDDIQHDIRGVGSSIIDNAIHSDYRSEKICDNKSTLIVHNSACNEGKTSDGIIKGGERLADEFLDVIRSEVKQREQQSKQKYVRNEQQDCTDVTISIVGNSLGGLYGRYAIAHLAEILESPTIEKDSEEKSNETAISSYHLLDGNIRIHFNVFCSTAAPHLGCASHTYFPIPRTAEIGVAQVMGETGSDLFRLNDLVQTMAISPRFLKPLASFRRRIAYANAYGTDFPVPGATAAFLNKGSDYPHYFDEYFVQKAGDRAEVDNDNGAETASLVKRVLTNKRQERECPASERGIIVATVHTPRLPMEERTRIKDTLDDLTAMSSSLDALGWKKVFIDIRNEIPMTVYLPTLSKAHCPIDELKSSNGAVTSCDLEKAISGSRSYRLSLPLGHNAICAFSRGTVSTAVNIGGRPVMDSLSIDLTDEISLWNGVN